MKALFAVGSALLIGFLVASNALAQQAVEPPPELAEAFHPPVGLEDDLGSFSSLLRFEDGREVKTSSDWRARRDEILTYWHGQLGAWPPLLDHPQFARKEAHQKGGYREIPIVVEVVAQRLTEGYLLLPEGKGPFPAMLVVYYEPETAVGLKQPLRDFGVQLVKRGFAILSIGIDPRPIIPDAAAMKLQPLSYLALWAANAHTAMAAQPEVDARRIGVMGHSYGGKWSMFAAAFDERFACGVWSDPGIVFDETRPSVNYWEPWYLGYEAAMTRKPGLPTVENPRTGAYKKLIDDKRDLHEIMALVAPRPFLVSGGEEDQPKQWRALNHVASLNRLLGYDYRVAMTNREGHTPTEESNRQIVWFLEYVLKPDHQPKEKP